MPSWWVCSLLLSFTDITATLKVEWLVCKCTSISIVGVFTLWEYKLFWKVKNCIHTVSSLSTVIDPCEGMCNVHWLTTEALKKITEQKRTMILMQHLHVLIWFSIGELFSELHLFSYWYFAFVEIHEDQILDVISNHHLDLLVMYLNWTVTMTTLDVICEYEAACMKALKGKTISNS